MRVKPNETILRARVRAIRPAADGWGADVDFDVVANDSPDSSRDFLRPKPRSTLTAFAAEPEKLHVGDEVSVVLSLNAGPSGERAVVRSAEARSKSSPSR
jgi:hypothetical protein